MVRAETIIQRERNTQRDRGEEETGRRRRRRRRKGERVVLLFGKRDRLANESSERINILRRVCCV